MAKAKKTLSLVMIAIFTTFIVLSGIPASAVTKAAATKQIKSATALVVKSEAAVKVKNFNYKTAQTAETTAVKQVNVIRTYGKVYAKTYTALAKRIAAVQKKINARKVAVAKAAKPKIIPSASTVAAKDLAAAQTAVSKAEDLTNTDTYDLVGSDTDLQNAQDAVTSALEAVVKLDNNSADYKGLMARIDAANEKIVKAMEDRDAAAAAIQAQKDEADAVAAAETAVKAVETAPLATAADLAAALDLGKTAADAVSKVTEPDKAADFTARLKKVADAGTALQAALDKQAADAKKAADDAAAAAAAKLPATLVSVSAVDGTITVTFSKKPLTTPVLADLTVTKSVNGTTAAAVTPTTLTVTNDTTVTLAVPAIAQAAAAQSVVYTVGYTTGAAVSAVAYTVAALPAFGIDSATAYNGSGVATPLANATGILGDKDRGFTVVFNNTVDTTTVNVNTFTLTSAGVTQPLASVTLGSDNKTVTVLPLSNLSESTQYTLTVGAAVKGTVTGTTLGTAATYTFTTGTTGYATTASTAGAFVTGVDIGGGTTSDVAFSKSSIVDSGAPVLATSTILVTFNKALDSSTVNTQNVKLFNVTDNVQVAAVIALNNNSTITVTPASDLTTSKVYKVVVNGVVDLLGNKVYQETLSFTNNVAQGTFTVNGPDGGTSIATGNYRVWPKLAAGTLDGNTTVQNGFKLYAQFSQSQALDPTTINATNIKLQKWDTTANAAISTVTCTYTYDSALNRITIVPTTDLDGGSTYKLTILNSLKDVFGKDSQSSTAYYAQTFKTYDVASPTIASYSLKTGVAAASFATIQNGATGVDESSQLTFQFAFNEPVGFGPVNDTKTNVTNFDTVAGVQAATNATNFAANKGILIYDASAATIASVDPTKYTVTRSTDKKSIYVTINGGTLSRNKTYTIAFAGKANAPTGSAANYDTLADITDNANAGYTNHNRLDTTLNFTFTTRTADTTAPTITSSFLDDGTTNIAGANMVDTSANLIDFVFSEPVQVTDAAPLTILNTTDGSTETLAWTAYGTAVTVATATTAATTTLTINDSTSVNVGDIVKITDGVNTAYDVVVSKTATTLKLDYAVGKVINTAASSVTYLAGLTMPNVATDANTLEVNLNKINGNARVPQNKAINLTLNASIEDLASTPNAFVPVTYSFTTGVAPSFDTTAAYPSIGQSSVPTKATYIIVPVNDGNGADLDVNTLNATNITIKKVSDSSAAPYTLTYVDAANKVADVIAVNNVAGYAAGLSSVAYDGAGNADVVEGSIVKIKGYDYVVTATTGTTMTIYPALRTALVDNDPITLQQGVVFEKNTTSPSDTISLAGNAQYRVAVAGIKNSVGDVLSSKTLDFLTVDNVAPTITYVKAGTTDITSGTGFSVGTDSDISIKFSAGMTWDTAGTADDSNMAWANTGASSHVNTATNGLYSKTVYLRQHTSTSASEATEAGATFITAYYTYDSTNNILKIVPLEGQLQANTSYDVIVYNSLKGSNGTAIDSTGGYNVYTFSTATSIASESVTATLNTTTNRVTLTFNYPVIAPTNPVIAAGSATDSTIMLPAGSFVYGGAGGSSLAGWSVSSDKQSISFTPAAGSTSIRSLVVGDSIQLGGIATPSTSEIQPMTNTFALVAGGNVYTWDNTGAADTGDSSSVSLGQ